MKSNTRFNRLFDKNSEAFQNDRYKVLEFGAEFESCRPVSLALDGKQPEEVQPIMIKVLNDN